MDYDLKLCGGCTTCEIACSFRHTGSFNNRLSSIEVVPLEDRPGYKVRLHEQSDGKRFACDGCIHAEGLPPCVEYCVRSTELMDIIEDYRAKHSSDSLGKEDAT